MLYQHWPMKRGLEVCLRQFAARAEAVDLEAVADELVVCIFAYPLDHVLDVIEVYVLDGGARDASDVMVVAIVAYPVADAAIVEDHATDQALVEQELQRPVHGRSPDGV